MTDLLMMGPAAAEPLADMLKGAPGDTRAMLVLEKMATDPYVQQVLAERITV